MLRRWFWGLVNKPDRDGNGGVASTHYEVHCKG